MRIIIDMDEVLANTYVEFGLRYFQRYGVTVTDEQLVGKKYYDLEGGADLRNEMFKPGFFRNLPVMEDAQEVVRELYDKHEIFIVTTATEFKYSMLDKWEWLEEHFPFISHKRIVFCGNKAIVRGDYMIDDKVRNLKPFNGTGILFDSPHNFYDRGFHRVYNWREVRQYFAELEAGK